jgi:hypothetical protein
VCVDFDLGSCLHDISHDPASPRRVNSFSLVLLPMYLPGLGLSSLWSLVYDIE